MTAMKELRTAQALLEEHASKILKEVDAAPIFLKQGEYNYRVVPRFGRREIKIGKVLGVGSFGVVREITQIVDDGFNGKSSVLMIDELKPPLNSIVNLPPHRPAFIPEFSPRTSSLDDSNASVTSVVSATSKGTMAKRCIRDGRARYAIKYILKEELTELEIARARIDLAIEVKYLQALDHPNIVKIRGVYDTDDMLHQNFFFLMDRLFGTLEERMKDWQMLEKMSRGTILKIERDKTALSDLLNKKVLVFCDLASAFTYLHSEKVIHRDLKPENVAFDIRGNCKLFDFGLARSMHPDLVDRDDLYRLTGETGSFPYMAPEIALMKPYNEKSDVFSFGVLMWEVLSLKAPFSDIKSRRDLREKVYEKGQRPSLPRRKWPRQIEALIQDCWHNSPAKRPSMKQASEILCSVMEQCTKDESIHVRHKDLLGESTRSLIDSLGIIEFNPDDA